MRETEDKLLKINVRQNLQYNVWTLNLLLTYSEVIVLLSKQAIDTNYITFEIWKKDIGNEILETYVKDKNFDEENKESKERCLRFDVK